MLIERRSLLATVIAGTVAVIGSASAQAQTTLNLSDVLPEGNFMVKNAMAFADAVKDATDGRVIIEVHPGGALGFKGPEQMRAVGDGLVPMADVLTSQQQGDEPFLGTETIPFLISSYDDLRALHKLLRPRYEAIAEKYNQKILYMVPSPLQYIYLKEKIGTVDGLRGIKIRGADKTTVDIWSAVGMSGVQIPWGELIPALASGRVDAVSTSATSGVDGKFWEFLKYVYPTNHTWSSNMVTINLDTWKSLSEEDRAAIEKVAAEMEPGFWDVSAKADKKSVATMQEHGMELVTIPQEMMQGIRERAAPLKEEFLERVPNARPIVEEYLNSVGRS